MSQILVRNLKPETVERLKKRAKENNRSLEAEVREILDDVVLSARIDQPTPELRRFREALARGEERNKAFLEYSRAIRGKVPFDPVNSADDIRAEREERDARFG